MKTLKNEKHRTSLSQFSLESGTSFLLPERDNGSADLMDNVSVWGGGNQLRIFFLAQLSVRATYEAYKVLTLN